MSRPKSTRRKPRRRDDPAVLEALRVELAARLDRLRATIMAKRADCIASGLTVRPLDPADGWSPDELAFETPSP